MVFSDDVLRKTEAEDGIDYYNRQKLRNDKKGEKNYAAGKKEFKFKEFAKPVAEQFIEKA